MAMNLQGSWVAMPIPFTAKGEIDFDGFKVLIDRQIRYGTNQLFVLGSAAEVTLLSLEEKKAIVRETIRKSPDSGLLQRRFRNNGRGSGIRQIPGR